MTAHLINVAELETFFKFNAAITVVDVRKKPAVESEPAMIKGAVWHAHDAVDIWADDLPNGRCRCLLLRARPRGQPKRGRCTPCQGA